VIALPTVSVVPTTATFAPFVPDACTRLRAFARSGFVHLPDELGSCVYGQYGL